ncbi:MAG: hypothetical protein AAGJ37_00460 [Pseudomonadota bacterium]
MNTHRVDQIAEELGAVFSIIETLKNEYQAQEMTSIKSSIDQSDRAILLEYASGYIEQCFEILAHLTD